VVFSEPYLFDFSIYENIHLGNVGASKEEVIEVAKLVRMHYSVMSLPEGYDTKVGEAGVKLSSGEKQKIALARAILKGAPVILLDEVTKSIDQESKISIKEAIKRIKDKKNHYNSNPPDERNCGRK
jgi:ABC-type multidrug transport system fused ATPase/permease subunit